MRERKIKMRITVRQLRQLIREAVDDMGMPEGALTGNLPSGEGPANRSPEQVEELVADTVRRRAARIAKMTPEEVAEFIEEIRADAEADPDFNPYMWQSEREVAKHLETSFYGPKGRPKPVTESRRRRNRYR